MKAFSLFGILFLCFINQRISGAGLEKKLDLNCDCPNFGGFLKCDPETCDWLLLNGYWAGSVQISENISEFVIASCPYGYCLINDTDSYVRIPYNMTDQYLLNEFLCNTSNRKQEVCGHCQPGYVPAINYDSNYCTPCDVLSSKVNWIYYLLSVYIPLLLVFLAIIIFNVQLTNGPLNSFIIFAQVISTTVDISQQGASPLNVVYGSGTTMFNRAYVALYNVFNLNLFGNLLPPFCLHEGLTALDNIALRYIEAFFPVFIVIMIILFVQCQRLWKIKIHLPSCCMKFRVRGSLLQAFAAFILLSYNRVCEITAYLLTPTLLYDKNLKTVQLRLFFQGNLLQINPLYVTHYEIPAYIMTALLIIVPIVLLHYPLKWIELTVSKITILRKIYPFAMTAILLDTFQGCFKNNRRYFAGLYLAMRLLLFYAYFQPWHLQLLIQQIIFVSYIFLVAILKPYREEHWNGVDIAMFSNLALINALSWFTVTEVQTGSNTEALVTCVIIESILVFLPFIYFIAYLIWKVTDCFHEDIKKKVLGWLNQAKWSNVFEWFSHAKYQETDCRRAALDPDSFVSNHTDDDNDIFIKCALGDDEVQYGATRVSRDAKHK